MTEPTRCPYCRSDRFLSEATLAVSPTLSGLEIQRNAVWENTCYDCGGSSYYLEESHTQVKEIP